MKRVGLLCCALAVLWPGGDVASRTSRTAQGSRAVPTFNQQVAPILFDHCVACHRPDGVGPMSLLTWADARGFGERIRAKVTSREMPPWYADGRYGQFKNARGLTQMQIDLVEAWVEGGMPQGDGKAPALPRFPPDGWRVQYWPDWIPTP